MNTAAEKWNAMTSMERHGWLWKIKVANYSFRYLDWLDLPPLLKSEIERDFAAAETKVAALKQRAKAR